MNTPDRPISELKELALEKGDIEAFDILITAYLDYPPSSFLPIAKEMADKHQYHDAYFWTYLSVIHEYGLSTDESLHKVDGDKKALALEYLILGAVKGHKQSIDILRNYYLNAIELDSSMKNYEGLVRKYGKSLQDLVK